ncbi:MAG: 16S rRNA (guanine(966)-N(2))-methyltransferase RsmD [Clostridia bacterium]|nr:16S rRNA (guanine(966)-N(2))-methyltransferase RsmD [Clostridia bacterium]
MMRIITGKAKGIRLETLEGNNTRPTSERAKEAVFSMIRFDLEGRDVLDLYAGSGQMGLEAVSCGAASATLVDKSKEAAAIIRKNIDKTRLGDYCNLFCADVNDFLRTVKGRKKYDIVFIDPPYALHAIPDVLSSLLTDEIIKPTSIIVCESEESDIFEDHPDLKSKFDILKYAKYGAAHITIVMPTKS